ncbi:MAG TPA: recombinase family protein [Candidatus Sulfotelmatobacter sp.]
MSLTSLDVSEILNLLPRNSRWVGRSPGREPVPAAQYLRMSTEHQQYSIENQTQAVQEYAIKHGFEIVKTYSDPARSGLVLRNRAGLRNLLKDIVSGNLHVRAVLVYDVSRWGRFQDTDESACYEFLCKTSGVQVEYCAELFTNDGKGLNSLVKNIKRTMAAEYSRELGNNVFDAKVCLVRRGYWAGGPPTVCVG